VDDNPITELDFASCDEYLDKETIHKKVQSMKRLLKQRTLNLFNEGVYQIIHQIIDECIQIPEYNCQKCGQPLKTEGVCQDCYFDTAKGAAKGGAVRVDLSSSAASNSKPPRKSPVRKYDCDECYDSGTDPANPELRCPFCQPLTKADVGPHIKNSITPQRLKAALVGMKQDDEQLIKEICESIGQMNDKLEEIEVKLGHMQNNKSRWIGDAL